jgi:hypothetical protein
LDEQAHINDAIKGASTGALSVVAIIGHIFSWFPTEIAVHFIDVASGTALGAVSLFYLGRSLYRVIKGKMTDTTTTA